MTFTIELLEPKGYGVKLGKIKYAVVTLTNDEEFKKLVDKFAQLMAENSKAFQIGSETWREQLRASVSMPEPEDGEENSVMDYLLHFLSFYWKLVMALVPPTAIWGGWATFVSSLAVTGLLTALVGDLAGMFG